MATAAPVVALAVMKRTSSPEAVSKDKCRPSTDSGSKPGRNKSNNNSSNNNGHPHNHADETKAHQFSRLT